jgi:hypothetical protein
VRKEIVVIPEIPGVHPLHPPLTTAFASRCVSTLGTGLRSILTVAHKGAVMGAPELGRADG